MAFIKKVAKAISKYIKEPDKKPVIKPIAGIIDGREVDDIVTHVKNLVDAGRDARDTHPMWDNYADTMLASLQLYIGDHYNAYNDRGLLSSLGLTKPETQYVSENHIFPIVETQTGIITANRPGFQWKASGDIKDTDAVTNADNVSKAFDLYTQNMGIVDFYPDAMRNSLIFGHKLAMLEHCFERDASYGKERMRLLDPLAIVFNPGAKEWETAKYRGAVVIENTLNVKAQWENFLGYLGKPKKIELSSDSTLNLTEAKYWDLQYHLHTRTLPEDDDIGKGLTIVLEYDDMTRVPVINREITINPVTGEEVITETTDKHATERKYPNGRLFIIHNDTLIYDDVNPYEHGKSMLLYLPGKKVPGYLLGVGIPVLAWDMQKNINESVTQINLNTNLTANPPKIYDKDELGEDYVVSNVAGNCIGVSKQYMLGGIKPIEQLQYADNTGQAFNRYAELVTALYRIFGIEEAVRGISKSGDSGRKVENLFQNATNRFRPDITQAEVYFLEPYARALMKNMIQFAVNDTMSIGERYESGLHSVRLYDTLMELKQRNIELELRLVVGVSTPDQRSYMAQTAIMYKQLMPNIPQLDEVVLQLSDIPQIQKIGIEMEQMRMLQMQNQQMLTEILPAAAQTLPAMQEVVGTFEQAKADEEQKAVIKQGVMTVVDELEKQAQAQQKQANKQ